MEQSENKSVVEKIRKIGKAMRGFGDPNDSQTFRAVISHFGRTIIPLISLSDGGKERGRFWGMLRKIGAQLPETVLRDKSFLGDEKANIRSQDLNEGIRLGMNTRINRCVVEIQTVLSKVNHEKMYRRIKDWKILTQEVLEMLRRKIGRL